MSLETAAISQLTPKVTAISAGDLFESSTNPGSGFATVSVTALQIAGFVLSQLSAAATARWQAGYGIQLFDNDPSLAAHPWRTLLVNNGVFGLSDGVPAVAPSIPVITAAAHAGGNNNLTFSWSDPNYAGTGTLEVYKNGASLVTGLGFGVTSYTDTGGTVGAIYQVRWNSGTFTSILSNSITAA